MARSFSEFIQGVILQWIRDNAEDPASLAGVKQQDFWLVPLAIGDPEYRVTTERLLERFTNVAIGEVCRIDKLTFGSLSATNGERAILVAGDTGVDLPRIDESQIPFQTTRLTFLERMDFICRAGLQARRPIPNRLVTDSLRPKDPLFEADLEPYLPDVAAWSVPKDLDVYGEDERVGYCRIITAFEASNPVVARLAPEITQLALALPESGHSWLFDQYYFALTCRRPEHMFMGLYRLLEFFFPMKGLEKLRSSLRFEGSILELRRHCSESLNWNVNHQYGLRAATEYCGVKFACICLQKDAPAGEEASQITRFKHDAIEKLAELRHRLAHQPFEDVSVAAPEIERFIAALLELLREAFESYRSVNLVKPSPKQSRRGRAVPSDSQLG